MMIRGVRFLRGWLVVALALLAARACEDNAVTVTTRQEGNVVRFFAATRDGMDVTLTIVPTLENMSAAPSLPCTVDLSGRGPQQVLTLQPRNPTAAWRYTYTFHWVIGGRRGRSDHTAIYQLPYAATQFHRLQQGNFGKFSHGAGSQNERAFDFQMPIGTEVCAAREGVVTGVRVDSVSGGADPSFKSCGNYVIVRHPDGTYAEYFHLKTGGAKVKVGDRVSAGQVVAYSGNTGYSTEPHLHFCVFKTLDGNTRETLPVQFRLKNGNVESLVEGHGY
ncbi:MAG: mepM [Verrucomicrobia bacterium]|nr:mepM [Verrucomicrobiota bacterium]